MKKGRLEAFSDGVIAIIITIMVLELKVPDGDSIESLKPIFSIFISYLMSFAFIGIYWNNHHHLFQAVQKVNGRILWLNMHLLFWLSLIPFGTSWMGSTNFSTIPVALYGVNLFFAGIAYFILSRALILHHGTDSQISRALGSDLKGKISTAIYIVAIPLSFVNSWIAFALYNTVAIMWMIPDKRIEKTLSENKN